MQMQTTCVRVKEETMEALKKQAVLKKRSTTQLIRIILEDYIEKINL